MFENPGWTTQVTVQDSTVQYSTVQNPGWTTQVTPVPSLVSSNHYILCPVHPLPAGDRPGEAGVPPQLPGDGDQ